MFTKQQAINFRQQLNSIIENLQDDKAINMTILFPEWHSGKNYQGLESETPSRVQYNNILYKCLQGHTSQDDWTPDIAVSLWVRVDNPMEEWPEWIQPVGAQDAYSQNAKVSHNDKHWISNVDNNVWEPGVYGWTEDL